MDQIGKIFLPDDINVKQIGRGGMADVLPWARFDPRREEVAVKARRLTIRQIRLLCGRFQRSESHGGSGSSPYRSE